MPWISWSRHTTKHGVKLMLTKIQQEVVEALLQFYKQGVSKAVVAGYAKTGKTTVLIELVKRLRQKQNIKIAFLTWTKQEAEKLRKTLLQHELLSYYDFCGSCYKFNSIAYNGFDLALIDNVQFFPSLKYVKNYYYHFPVYIFGDHMMLASGNNVVVNPDFFMEDIIGYPTPVRDVILTIIKDGEIPHGILTKSIFKASWTESVSKEIWNNIDFLKDDVVVLCAFNTTRFNINRMIREKYNFTKAIVYPGEKVLSFCNNPNINIYTGDLAKVVWTIPPPKGSFRISLEINDNIKEVTTSTQFFDCVTHGNNYAYSTGKFVTLDYGYCMTVHRARVRTWPRVVIVEERHDSWNDEYYKQWLYTAVTRSTEKIFVISDFSK